MHNLENITRSQLESAINEYVIGKNAERNRKILCRRFIDGICLEPLAEEFSLSVTQIKTIIYKYEKIVFKHL